MMTNLDSTLKQPQIRSGMHELIIPRTAGQPRND